MAKKKIFPGQLNQRIVFYNTDNLSNQSGGAMPKKVKYWDTSAKVAPLKSARTLQALQTQLIDGFHITVRDRRDKDIQPDATIYYRGGWLSIISCIPDYVYDEYMTVIAVWSRRPLRISDRVWDNENGFAKNFTYVKGKGV